MNTGNPFRAGKALPGMLMVLLSASPALAEENTLSEDLLHTYFATAGVCTTSSIRQIEDDGRIVFISIDIENSTRNALTRMTQYDRDNWFSLHCPPQIHGVWQQASPPEDILVEGWLAEDQAVTLSCVDFHRERWEQRETTLTEKLRGWLQRRASP